MPRQEIRHKMSWKELDNLTDERLVPILRAKGMNVVFRPFAERIGSNWGCVAASGSTFTWTDSTTGFRDKTFIWKGELELTEQEKATASFMHNIGPHESGKVRIEDQFATRCIRLED